MNLFFVISALMMPKIQAELINFGSFKYQVSPGQKFEHEFFHIQNVTQIDFYQSQSPFNRIEEGDLIQNWTKQETGTQQLAECSVNTQSENKLQGDLLCMSDDLCYMTAGSTLYVVNGLQMKVKNNIINQTTILVNQEIPLPFPGAKIADLSSIGLLALYGNQNPIEILDITFYKYQKKYTLPKLLELSLQSSIDVLSNPSTHTLYVNVGKFVEIWNIQKINQIYKIGDILMNGVAQTQQQKSTLLVNQTEQQFMEMKIYENLLFVFSSLKGVVIFEISDPHSIKQVTLKQEDNGLSLQSFRRMIATKGKLILLYYDSILQNYKLLHYIINTNMTDIYIVQLKLLLFGQVDMISYDLAQEFAQVDNQSALLVEDNKVFLITLRYSYNNSIQNLSVSNHSLPSNKNQIYQVNGNFLQFHDNKLKMFKQSITINMVFLAPNSNLKQDVNTKFYGIIRSDQLCPNEYKDLHVLPNSDLQKILESQQLNNQTQCLLSFELDVEVVRENSMKKRTLLIGLVIFVVLLTVLIEQARKRCKKSIVQQTLRKFEELNKKLQIESKKERIRITHHNIDNRDDDSEEWRSLSSQQESPLSDNEPLKEQKKDIS